MPVPLSAIATKDAFVAAVGGTYEKHLGGGYAGVGVGFVLNDDILQVLLRGLGGTHPGDGAAAFGGQIELAYRLILHEAEAWRWFGMVGGFLGLLALEQSTSNQYDTWAVLGARAGGGFYYRMGPRLQIGAELSALLSEQVQSLRNHDIIMMACSSHDR